MNDPDMILLHEATPEQQAAAQVVVIYHANNSCRDGWLCAVLAKYIFDFKQGKQCLFEPRFYEEPFNTLTLPLYTGKEVYIFDFSFAPEILDLLTGVAAKLLLLDHHKTFAEANGVDPKIEYVQQVGSATLKYNPHMCGAQMVYKEFFDELELFCPLSLVNYVGDRDLWKWEMHGSHEIIEYLSTIPHVWKEWRILIESFWNEDKIEVYQHMGQTLLRVTQIQVDRLAAASFKCTFDFHHNVRVCNTQSFQSEVGHRILELFPDAPFAVMYYDKDQYTRIWSLRGRAADKFDCTTVAKKFGGGGHAKACGFKTGPGNDPLSTFKG